MLVGIKGYIIGKRPENLPKKDLGARCSVTNFAHSLEYVCFPNCKNNFLQGTYSLVDLQIWDFHLMPSYSTKSFLLYLNSRAKSDQIFRCSPMNYIKQSPSFIFLAGILQEPVVMFSLFLWVCLFDLKAAKVLKHSNYFCFSIKYSVSPQKILFASSQQKNGSKHNSVVCNECVCWQQGDRLP